MKTATLVCCLLIVAGAVSAADPAAMKTPSGWFDMSNCDFCKFMLEDPDMLSHVTWETHRTKRGMLHITTVDPAYAEAYQKSNQAMEKLGTEMMTGKVDPAQVKMCGHCREFGQLLMSGVDMETIQGEQAEVTLITTTDPAMVAKIHAFAERNRAEFALLTGSESRPHAH